MPKLNAWQSALVSLLTIAVSLVVAFVPSFNSTAQIIIAVIPPVIANIAIVGAAIVNAIHDHTAAVTAAIKAAKA
jgi:hypothetical protein